MNTNITSVAEFVNANLAEFKSKVQDFEGIFDLIDPDRGINVVEDESVEDGIEIAFDRNTLVGLYGENDPYNVIEEVEINGTKVYYVNYL